MAISQQTKPLSTFKILCEAFKLPTKNLNLTLTILLLSFLASSITSGTNYLSTDLIFRDLAAKLRSIASIDPSSPEYTIIHAAIVKDLKELLCIETIFVVASYVVNSLLKIATIHAFSLMSCGKPSTVKDLLCRLGRGLKGPMITMLYISFLNLGYIFLLFAGVGVIVFSASGSVALITSGIILALLGLILYMYLVMVWLVGVVISVVEDNCYGLDAISKAAEKVRGRRRQLALLMLIVFVIPGVPFGAYNAANGYVPSPVMTLVTAAVGVLVSMFATATVMVFYWDCKRSNGGDGSAMMINGGFMYATLLPAAHADVQDFDECKV